MKGEWYPRPILTYLQFLSATIDPLVACVSATRSTPSLYVRLMIVIPVLVALGNAMPLDLRFEFLWK